MSSPHPGQGNVIIVIINPYSRDVTLMDAPLPVMTLTFVSPLPHAHTRAHRRPTAPSAALTDGPTVAPTVIPPYQPLPVDPPGEKCIENGTLAPMANPSVDDCYVYCSLYGGFTSLPSYFNYFSLNDTSACFCVGSNCTAAPAYNYGIIKVNNKTIATLSPSNVPSIRYVEGQSLAAFAHHPPTLIYVLCIIVHTAHHCFHLAYRHK